MLESIRSPLQTTPSRRLALVSIVALIAAIFIYASFSESPAPAQANGLASEPFFVLALLAFAGGLFSFVSPYTLPILPAYFAFATQSGRSRIALNTVAFMLGVATMFSLLGASASILGRVLLQNQQLLLLVITGAFLWVFSARGDQRTTLNLHGTQTVSGLLFIGMAVLMLNGTLAVDWPGRSTTGIWHPADQPLGSEYARS